MSLLNEAREKTDAIIDELHIALERQTAASPDLSRQSPPSFRRFHQEKENRTRQKIRQAIEQQLGFLKRNLKAIDRLLENPVALPLT